MLSRYSDLDRSFSVIDQLRRRMDRLFEEGVQASGRGYPEEAERVWSRGRFPRISFTDAGTTLVLEAEMPGLVNFEKGRLTIEGRLPAFTADEEPFDYRRSFVVPQGIDAEKIAANLQNGVLRLSLPKPAAAKPRQIEIKSA